VVEYTCILEGNWKDESVEKGPIEEWTERTRKVVENGLVFTFEEHESQIIGQAQD